MKTDGVMLFPTHSEMEKLLEMGRHFYPEYNKQAEEDIWFIQSFDLAKTYFICINQDSGCLRIHWFEFLIKWIGNKIYSAHNISSMKDPVSTVYESFKQDFLVKS